MATRARETGLLSLKGREHSQRAWQTNVERVMPPFLPRWTQRLKSALAAEIRPTAFNPVGGRSSSPWRRRRCHRTAGRPSVGCLSHYEDEIH